MESRKTFIEVLQTEKQLLALIYSKGISHDEVLGLYRNIRTGYEKILLNIHQIAELQEIEYHLWKLHYKLIDEFRKKCKPQSSKPENTKNGYSNSQDNVDKSLDAGFVSFLSEASEFYRDLVVKLRKGCGLTSEIFLNKKGSSSVSVQPQELLAVQYSCHRLFVCLGDLARYTETFKKPDVPDWSTAAMYYLEATRTWPDSGNPHNQLALLATYVGDSFLALYHCIRSLAVKEPFPDAWRNLMVVFEENRSTQLPLKSCQLEIDFLNPSKRISLQTTTLDEIGSPNEDKLDTPNNFSEKINLWPIFVRTVSFLLIRSSSEEFPSTLAAILNSLEALLVLDDAKLTEALESHQYTKGSSKRGPYRAIQLVSIFIFIVHSLTESPETEDQTGRNDQKSSLTPLAFASIFIFMGRVTERCMMKSRTNACPLLPAVLVFIEWLAEALHTTEAYMGDERVSNAMSYFFGSLLDLLDRSRDNGSKSDLDYTALWEDHELRGFYPLAAVHEMLDFDGECSNDFHGRDQYRSDRIFHAASRIADRSQKWISYEKIGGVLSSVKNTKFQDQVEQEEKPLPEKIKCSHSPEAQSLLEEEEVILFRPITRRNSAPLYISKAKIDPVLVEGIETGETPPDELRRATSLSVYQDQEDIDSFSFFSTTPNSGQNWSFKQKEPPFKDSTPHLTGPPSLSGWVLSQDFDIEKGLKDFHKEKLTPIEEIPSSSFQDLSINETKASESITGHISTIVHNSPRYVTPTPSAPLLPDDAGWLRGNSLIVPESKSTPLIEADGILGAAPYANLANVRPTLGFVPGVSGLVDGYPPLLGMSSSEWLYHYRNSQSPSNHMPPIHYSPPIFGNFHSADVASFDLYDQWGNRVVPNPMVNLGSPQFYPSSPLVLGGEEAKRDKIFVGYQRPFPYGCGVGMEVSEQPPLLHHLKEKEWQLQPGSQMRGPFMGNLSP